MVKSQCGLGGGLGVTGSELLFFFLILVILYRPYA